MSPSVSAQNTGSRVDIIYPVLFYSMVNRSLDGPTETIDFFACIALSPILYGTLKYQETSTVHTGLPQAVYDLFHECHVTHSTEAALARYLVKAKRNHTLEVGHVLVHVEFEESWTVSLIPSSSDFQQLTSV